MEKDYSKWFQKKPLINQRQNHHFAREREVRWCYLGINIGSEEDGKGENVSRPVLIFRRFSQRKCWVIPLTTQVRDNAFHIPVSIGDKIRRDALIQQLRLIDSKRLYSYIGFVDKASFASITKAISQITGFGWETKTSEATPDGAAPVAEAVSE